MGTQAIDFGSTLNLYRLKHTPTRQLILAALKDIDVMSWFYLTSNDFEIFATSFSVKTPNIYWIIDDVDRKRVVVPFEVYKLGYTEAALWVSEKVKKHLEEKDQ